MCGFAGLLTAVGFTQRELEAYAERMAAPLVHRGPDDSGVWAKAAGGIAFGFRRLAILDLSPKGHQPMRSPFGRFVGVFNGELYNFKELRSELTVHGYSFKGSSDTEVVLAAFEQWGIQDAVRRFVGMYAIAVWDDACRQLSLVRDRLGKKPLFVYREPGLISFGSELKALLAGPSFNRAIDRAALGSYLRYLYVPAPRTIFQHAIKLPPGSILTINDPSAALPAPAPYWSVRQAAFKGLRQPLENAEEEILDEFDSLLTEAVRCRLYSDVPLGALLSGGIDSSTIVALMQEASSRPVKTFTIGFAEEEFNEAHHAARVAHYLGTDHAELILTGEDACSLVPKLPDVFDEPLADPSQLPTLLVSQLARRDVTVALCGDGGDELFGGYNRYVFGTRVLTRMKRVPLAVRQPVAAGMGSVPSSAWSRLSGMSALLPGVSEQRFGDRVHKLATVMRAESVGDMYRSLVSAWQQPEDVVPAAGFMDDPTAQILGDPHPVELLDRMMLADQTTYLPDDLLAKVDRASMAVGLEVRAPLLDHRVVEFSWRLPRALKLNGATGKWILRQLLYRRLPRPLVDRPKMGFSVPIERWLCGPLRQWASDLLTQSALSSGGLDPAPVGLAWKELLAGRPRTAPGLWAVLMYQAWRQRWLN